MFTTFHLERKTNLVERTALFLVKIKVKIENRVRNVVDIVKCPFGWQSEAGNETIFSKVKSHLRAGVCRPCHTTELTATSWNFSLCRRVQKVCADWQLFGYS